MKKFLFLMTALGLLNVLFINQADAQSCCADKSSCLKVTSMMEKVKQEEAKQSPVVQALPVRQACLQASTTAGTLTSPVRMYSASYLFSQFGVLVTKMAEKIKSNDPCCLAKGCDPSSCDVSHCKPAQCSSSMAKN
jgi:hypothetical protein